jgi:hypothetical protein
MMNTKFIVKLNYVGKRGAEYVNGLTRRQSGQQTSSSGDLMGKFTAEDVVKSIENARCKAQLVSVRVLA